MSGIVHFPNYRFKTVYSFQFKQEKTLALMASHNAFNLVPLLNVFKVFFPFSFRRLKE